jgi:hypothetical protein
VADAYIDRFRTFESEIERRCQDLEEREIAYQECQSKMEEYENAIRIANDELAEHQPVLSQANRMLPPKGGMRSNTRGATGGGSRDEGEGDREEIEIGPNLAQEYLEAVAERDKITQSQEDWTRRLRQLVAKLPGFAPLSCNGQI